MIAAKPLQLLCGGTVHVPAQGTVRVDPPLNLVDLRNGELRVTPPMQLANYGTHFILSNADVSGYPVEWEYWR